MGNWRRTDWTWKGRRRPWCGGRGEGHSGSGQDNAPLLDMKKAMVRQMKRQMKRRKTIWARTQKREEAIRRAKRKCGLEWKEMQRKGIFCQAAARMKGAKRKQRWPIGKKIQYACGRPAGGN
jgi:hypothetical protein